MEPYTKENFDSDIKTAVGKAMESSLYMMDLISSLESAKISLTFMLLKRAEEKGVL